MASTEAGWTKGLPKVDGDYFCRLNEHDLCPVSFRLENGKIYEYGCGGNHYSQYVAKWDDYEYLGPFSASDAEELMELRRVAMLALKCLQGGDGEHTIQQVKDQLFATLNPPQAKER